MRPSLLELLRCPVCRSRLRRFGEELWCQGCNGSFPVRDGIPRLLDDRLPGIREKRGEIAGWAAMAREEGWYEPDDEVDAHLPFLVRDLGWDDQNWLANEHSFQLLLDRWVRPGMRVLEVGAAKCWGAQHLVPRGCAYVGADILDDDRVGLGRGAFYEARVGPFERVQADAEHLPFAPGSFDLVYCVATLHHALDLRRMVRELGRVCRPGGVVAALNEGTRPLGRSGVSPEQEHELTFGINEHVHSVPAYLWAFARAGLVVRQLERANGYAEFRKRHRVWKITKLPLGQLALTLAVQTFLGYSGTSFYARKPALRAAASAAG
jgi:SAM-dependent methyltransferase